MRIITNKILLITLLGTSLFLTGCSISDENTKEDAKPTEVNTTETEESSGFFGSLFGGEADETPKVKEAAEIEESSGFLSTWFGGDEKDVKDNSKKNKGIKSAVNKKYSKLTGKQQEIIASIKIDAEAERKRRIEAVKVGNINAKVVAKIAKQTRLEDVESRLKEALGVLNAQLKSEEGNLAKDSQAELKTKVKTLDIDIQDKVAQVKSNTKDKRVEAITSVERKISDTQSEVEHTKPAGADGTITLTFENCNSAIVDYDITSIDRQGSVVVQRVADDNIALCEALIADQQTSEQ